MNIWNILVLLGTIQGLILGLILILGKNRPKRQIWLGFLMLLLAYNGFEMSAWILGYFDNAPFNNLPRFTPLFATAACLYLYVRESLFPEKPLRPIWQYFLPVFLDVILRLFALSTSFFLNEQKSQFWDSKHLWFTHYLSVPTLILYLVLAIKLLIQFNKQDTQSLDNQQLITKSIVQNFLICLTPIVGLWSFTIGFADFLHEDSNIVFFYPVSIFLSILIYLVAFTGANQIKIIEIETKQNAQTFFNSIEKTEVENTLHALTEAMQKEKLHLNPDLNLTQLANHIQQNPKIISAVLNQSLNKGFNEFVNGYRIETVKIALLNNPQKRTISEIAFASGFNSLPTFQRVFKAQTNLSPKEFLKENAIKNGFE